MLTGLIIAALLLILVFIYYHIKEKLRYFEKRGIDGPKPEFFFGNFRDCFFKRRHISYVIDDIYRAYKDTHPIVGFYNITTPYLLVTDADLVKQILIKDFRFFRNNEFSALSDKKKDPVMALNPFFMRDEEWKEKRIEVATAMTQNKMRSMFPLIKDVAEKFAEYLKSEISSDPSKSYNSREICGRYTCDTVSSLIFAIDGESFTKDDSKIIEMGNKMMRSISDAAKSFFPKRLMPQDIQDFFISLMEQAINHRVQNNINRDDFLAHIITLKKKKEMSANEMVAHGVTFFLDGFETSAIALAAIFFELARNKRVQNKLRKELKESFPDTKDVTYEKLLENQYLDQVIYESLRIHPPVTFTNRECSETMELDSGKGKILVEKGTKVFIPLLSIQHDSSHFHDPEDFIPERFDHGTKEFKDKGWLLPFTDGPRTCLGMRFALLQLKCAVFSLVRQFEITVDRDETPEKLEIDPEDLLMNSKKGGMWLNFRHLNCE